MEFSSQNIGVGSFSLLQGIILTQGLNLSLPYYRMIFYQLNHKRSPKKPHNSSLINSNLDIVGNYNLKIHGASFLEYKDETELFFHKGLIIKTT